MSPKYVFVTGGVVSSLGKGLAAAPGGTDPKLAYKKSTLCDEYGVDLFDMAGVIAFSMECFEKGILTLQDTEGLKLEWGNVEGILSLIRQTTYRQGIGEVLAQGLKKASEIIGKGSEKFAMQVKGQSFTIREPRASKGWGLAYAVSGRGACH